MTNTIIQSLGYVGFPSASLPDWESYGTSYLGLQLAERRPHELVFRMDERRARIVVRDDGEHELLFGWDVRDRDALDALATRLEHDGTAVAWGSPSLAEQRCVDALITFSDRAGNRLEAFSGPATASAPFQPGRATAGFKTGDLGLGHVVLLTPRMDDDLAFYTGVLGFRSSDYVERPFRAHFLHVNARHHSLALIESDRRGIHHLMVENVSLDDVGRAYDLALRAEGRIATTLGRHTNDHVVSFYSRSPSDLMIETGWGGLTIDPQTWSPYELAYGPSLWGHQRDWLGPEAQAVAQRLLNEAAAAGIREPVHVTAGNYDVA